MAITTNDISAFRAQLTIWPLLGILGAVYVAATAIYRLYLAPQAGFPGPKLAAVTWWYELYYDVIKRGKYVFEIEKMHDKYGPIVRINPHELSIRDNEYYDDLYVAGNVRPSDRYDGFVSGVVDFEGSHLATIEHDMHRRRRKPLDPYFSRSGVTKLEPFIADLTARLVVERFAEYKGTGKPVRLDHAFNAYSGDVISALCIENPPKRFIDEEDFAPGWYELFHQGVTTLPIFMALPWLIHIIRLMPDRLLAAVQPKVQTWNTFKKMCDEHVVIAKKEQVQEKSRTGGRITLFRHLVDSDLPTSELSDERLSKEAQVLIGSGTITTAGTMCFIIYHVLANPAIKKRLEQELAPVMQGYPEKKPSLAELEKLEFLQAVLKESLRLSYGTLHRRPRVSPKMDLQFQKWKIPAGVPVGMSAYFQHRDATVFPEPEKFIPERWLKDVTPQMKKNFIPFSRGSRYCLGMNLANCELNFIVAALFRPGATPFDLFESDESDVKPAHDLVVPLPSLESKGFKVMFR